MKKAIHTLIILILLTTSAIAQVGFNNPNPDPSAVVDMKATDKGILIPRMTTGLRQAMAIGSPTPAQGLLVFDTSLNRLYFWNGTAWKPVNVVAADSTGANEIARIVTEATIGSAYSNVAPPNNGLIIEGNVGLGNSNPGSNKLAVTGPTDLDGNTNITGNLEVSGTVDANDYTLTTGSGNGPIPSGGIIMWSGSIASIPSGWALCDGTSGTPNLTDRFIVGAGNSYSIGNTGGHAVVTLTQAETPLKNHSHSINLTTSQNGSHSHKQRFDDANGGDGYVAHESADAQDCCSGHYYTDAAGEHTHSVQGNSASTENNTASAHENRPPYYALAFIMKL